MPRGNTSAQLGEKDNFRIENITFEGYNAFISNFELQFVAVVARFPGILYNSCILVLHS